MKTSIKAHEHRTRPGGMAGFTIVWLGQLVSVLASNMSGFALSIWMFQKTGSAFAMTAMQVSFVLPFMIITPFAGALVDRHNRKLMMMVSDLAAVLATISILFFQAFGQLQFWHLYVANVLFGLGFAFQWPAYSAAISTMVPKEKYGKANGMMSLIDSGPAVFSPLLAGALLPFLGLEGILGIDVLTFFLAIGALAFVHIPQPEKTVEGQAGKGSILKEAAYGFKYIFERKSLRVYLTVIVALNLGSGFSDGIMAPMILSRTDQNTMVFGAIQTAGAVGGVIGGLVMSAWGGFRSAPTPCWHFGPSSPSLGISCSVSAVGPSYGWLPPFSHGQLSRSPTVLPRRSGKPRLLRMCRDAFSPPGAYRLVHHPDHAAGVWQPGRPGHRACHACPNSLFAGCLLAGRQWSRLWDGAAVHPVRLPFPRGRVIAFLTPAFRNMETILPDHDQMEKIPDPTPAPGDIKNRNIPRLCNNLLDRNRKKEAIRTTLDWLDILFVSWGFLFQVLLIVHFSLRKWHFNTAMRLGPAIYALGVPAAVISLLQVVNAKPWWLWLGGFLCLAWGIFGYTIEYVIKIQWRNPPRWQVFIPYLLLYLSTLMFYWWPMRS